MYGEKTGGKLAKVAKMRFVPFGGAPFGFEEGFEFGSPEESVEDEETLVFGGLIGLIELKTFANPIGAFSVADVHILDANGFAVSAIEDRDDFAEGTAGFASKEASMEASSVGEEFLVQVGLGEAVGGEFELNGLGSGVELERVEVSELVAAELVSTDE